MNPTIINFVFKSLVLKDLPLLFAWFAQPYIAQLWPEPKTYAEFETKWVENIKRDHKFIAYIDNKPIAYIQYYHVTDKDRAAFSHSIIPEPSVGCDLFIGDPGYLGKGYGTQLLQQFIHHVQQAESACKAMIIDPASDNYRAIVCYEKVGFKKIGTYVVEYGTIAGPGPIELMIYHIA